MVLPGVASPGGVKTKAVDVSPAFAAAASDVALAVGTELLVAVVPAGTRGSAGREQAVMPKAIKTKITCRFTLHRITEWHPLLISGCT